MNNQQHIKALNFWRGSQNYSNFTIERGSTLASTQLNQPQTSQSSDVMLQTDPPTASIANQVANSSQDVLGTPPTQISVEPIATKVQTGSLGTPPTQENIATMPSTDVGGNNGGGQDLNLGSGSYGGGYGGGGFPVQEEEEIIEEEIKLPNNKILGLKPAHFYGGLLAAAVLGYLIFGRKGKGKTTKTIQ